MATQPLPEQELTPEQLAELEKATNPNPPEEEETDEYGRTEGERTITLESGDAEAINTEVNDGKHKTYSDALHYVITRGLAEIKRQREAARSLAEKTILKAKRDNWSKLLQSNPKLIENADLLSAMLKELGIRK